MIPKLQFLIQCCFHNGFLFFFFNFYFFISWKIWNTSRICVSSLRRGHASLLCVVPILVYVLPEGALHSGFQ